MDLFDMPISYCSWLPKTVSDKDGNECELLGVMVPKTMDWYNHFSLDATNPYETTSGRQPQILVVRPDRFGA